MSHNVGQQQRFERDQKEAPTRSRNKSITLVIIYINVILYATCYQIQRPLEPFLVEKLNIQGDSSDEYARLQSFFSVMQTIGSFVSGRFLDQFGAKGGFMISFISSALSYALLSQSTSLTILYISKIPSIFQAGFLCAQLAASQVTLDGAERVEALGRLTFCYTIGSIIGPMIGRYLNVSLPSISYTHATTKDFHLWIVYCDSHIYYNYYIGGILGASGDYYYGAKVAVAGSLISVLLTLFMPMGDAQSGIIIDVSAYNNDELDGYGHNEDDHHLILFDKGGHDASTKSKSDPDKQHSSGDIIVPSTLSVIQIVWVFLLTKVVTGVANAMSSAAMPLILKNIYKLNEQSLGFSMSILSAGNAVVNGFLLGPIVALFGGSLNSVISYCISSMCILSTLQAIFAWPTYTNITYEGGFYEYFGLTFILGMLEKSRIYP